MRRCAPNAPTSRPPAKLAFRTLWPVLGPCRHLCLDHQATHLPAHAPVGHQPRRPWYQPLLDSPFAGNGSSIWPSIPAEAVRSTAPGSYADTQGVLGVPYPVGHGSPAHLLTRVPRASPTLRSASAVLLGDLGHRRRNSAVRSCKLDHGFEPLVSTLRAVPQHPAGTPPYPTEHHLLPPAGRRPTLQSTLELLMARRYGSRPEAAALRMQVGDGLSPCQ